MSEELKEQKIILDGEEVTQKELDEAAKDPNKKLKRLNESEYKTLTRLNG